MKKNNKKTAKELMDQLNADPEYVAFWQRDEEERNKRVAEFRRIEAPLVEELQAAGFQVESSWDLVNTRGTYPSAVPILLSHLPRPYPPETREGIARALAVPEGIAGWDLLKRLYRDEQEEGPKDGLAIAIAGAANADVIADVIAFARDRTLGPSRIFLLRALERSTDPRALATLMSLGTDPDLMKEIQVILKRIERRNIRRHRSRVGPGKT